MWNYKYSLHGGRSFIMALALSRSLLYIFPGSVVLSIGSIAHCPSPNWQVSMSPGAGYASSWKQVEEVLLHCPLPRPPPNKTVTQIPGVRGTAACSFSIDISIAEIRPYLVVYGADQGSLLFPEAAYSPSPLSIGCFPPSIVPTFPRAASRSALPP